MPAELTIENLTVRYGPVSALNDVSLRVGPGEIVALVGANGAGKSTTLKAVMGLVPRASGRISVNGAAIGTRPGSVLAHGVSLSPEGRRLFPRLSVEENLLMGAYTVRDRTRTRQILAQVYDYFPRLLERRGQLAGSLSGGEQQMAAIGRALMADPKVLLLDEPSLGVAPIIVADIARIIREINTETGISILLVEQNAQIALGLSSRGYVLETGRVAASGTGQQLLESPDVREAYLGS